MAAGGLTVGPAMAQGHRYRDCHAGRYGDDGIAAVTRHSADDVFGLVCEAGECKWLLSVKRECTVGHSIPGLISNGVHAYKIDFVCDSRAQNPDFFRYRVESDESVDSALRDSSTELGFVTALKGGQFRVVRFRSTGPTMR